MFGLKRTFLLIVIVFMLFSCADDSDPLKIKGKSVNQVYGEAHAALDNSTYDKSIKLYNALEATYPYGIYAQQGMLDLAYAYYEYDQYENALSTIDQFINTYSTSSNMDYALYLKGYVNFIHDDGFFAKLTKQQSSELDPSGLKEAYKDFTELVTNYTQSKYAADAKNKINDIVVALADGEMLKSRYYMSIKAYIAAINRANFIITTYNTTSFVEEALAIEIVAYKNLKQTQLAEDTTKILVLNYPNSQYLQRDWVYRDAPWYKIY